MSSTTSKRFGKSSLNGQITDTVQPARCRAWASCQTRRSKGTGKFSTTMTQERAWRAGGIGDLRLSGFAASVRGGDSARSTPARAGMATPNSALPAEPPADANVTKSVRLHRFDRVNVAQVDDDRRGQAGFDPSEVESAELVPLGDDDRCVRTFEASIGIVRELDSGKQRLCRSNAFRVVSDNAGARRLQLGQDDEARRVTHVVGFGLVRETEHGNPFSGDRAAAGGDNLRRHRRFSLIVDVDQRFNQPNWRFGLGGELGQSQRILGEA